jgi:cold shock CspA family protein
MQRLRGARGFGCLREITGGEVFCHRPALPSPAHVAALTIGMVVEFEAEPSPKGLRATRVTCVSETRSS